MLRLAVARNRERAPCKFNFAMFPGTSGTVVNLSAARGFPKSPPRSHRGEFDNPRTEELHYSVSLERYEGTSQIQFT